MLARIWRFFVAIFDWRTMARKITGQPVVDAVFVTNMRDAVDRKRYLGGWHPSEGHFNGPRYWLNGFIGGRTRALDVVTEDLMTSSGRRKAREQFVAATRWAQKNGAKVILLAAATKRLFENSRAAELIKEFPDLVFTIGDNGTMLLLRQETLRALEMAGFKPGFCRIAVLGPYGFLGEMMTRALCVVGYDVIGAGPNSGGLARVAKEFGITTCKTFSEMGRVDAVVTCTHSKHIRLTAENIKLIRREGKKLLVIDVAEPSNLRYEEYQKCEGVVIRQDAGNAYAPGLKYVLGAISYRMFRLTKGVTFGCFAEALSIATALKRGEDAKVVDWLTVSDRNMELVAEMFARDGFRIPSPRCFGKSVRSFDLEIKQATISVRSAWRVAWEKLVSFFF